MRGMPRMVGAVLAAMVGLTLLAFNGTWLWPWEALSILALMFTWTMLYRAEQGQYRWRNAIASAVTVLGLVVAAGLWHSHAMGMSAAAELNWERCWFISVTLAGLTFATGLAFRRVRWPRILTWLGLISLPRAGGHREAAAGPTRSLAGHSSPGFRIQHQIQKLMVRPDSSEPLREFWHGTGAQVWR